MKADADCQISLVYPLPPFLQERNGKAEWVPQQCSWEHTAQADEQHERGVWSEAAPDMEAVTSS